MSNILANSAIELEQINDLLDKNVPSYRQAYSDRTAWIMACLSELAYIKFNPLFSSDAQKNYFVENISKLVGDSKKSSLVKLLDLVGYDHNKEREKLEAELSTLNMKIHETFDDHGTQAILASFQNQLVLAFRGTEATSLKDIKSDAKAKATQCETGGKIHSGFKDAFSHVHLDIQKAIDDEMFSGMPLFITGHSLGGALANVAAKKLSHKGGIAACYTFGSPRVGNDDWLESIKTPIYRLVNAADSVTMLPPGTTSITTIGWLTGWVPYIGTPFKKWLTSNFGGYLHGGNMRYLTNCPKGDFSKVKLLYSVNLFYRINGVFKKNLSMSHLLGDHSISIYRQKLVVIAQNRN